MQLCYTDRPKREKGGAYETSEKLAECPPDREDGEKILVRCRDKFWNELRNTPWGDIKSIIPRNMAESTGKLPPTPIDQTAANDVSVT